MGLKNPGDIEKFTAIRESSLKWSVGLILVYSVTSLKSFEIFSDIKDQIDLCRDGVDVPLVLLGVYSKYDKGPRVVTTEQGQEKAKKLECPFFEIDSHSYDQIEEVVKTLLPMALDCLEMMKKREKKDRDCVVM